MNLASSPKNRNIKTIVVLYFHHNIALFLNFYQLYCLKIKPINYANHEEVLYFAVSLYLLVYGKTSQSPNRP
jgi:hypothetical protein